MTISTIKLSPFIHLAILKLKYLGGEALKFHLKLISQDWSEDTESATRKSPPEATWQGTGHPVQPTQNVVKHLREWDYLNMPIIFLHHTQTHKVSRHEIKW